MHLRKTFFAFLSFLSISAFSQGNTGTVKFLVEVDNGYFEILIDDTLYLKNYKTTLEAGQHSAKVWSPGYITTEVSFEIKANETVEQFVEMAISNERQVYEKEYSAYRMKFHKSLTIPGSVTLATAITSGTFMILAYDRKIQTLKDVDLYHAAPNLEQVELHKSRIAINNSKYNRYRAGYYITGGLSILSLATTIYTYTKFKKNNIEPTLNSESPFKDRFSWSVSPVSFGLTYRIG
ncbi:MAG: hypothetical protein BM555_07105 [Crocinitomix sp. MedPE-SWsnd]|nr:MAG: hypothetical protein BM555_07105 [Crocinitomix sp. MedPE-SWsnd]